VKALRLALRTLAREWRSGELGVLLLALTVAVAALTGVGFLVSRISAAVALQASAVLAADIRLGSPQPLAEAYFAEAAASRAALRAQHQSALGGVQRGCEPAHQLAAVSAGYPLRGRCWSPANRSREVHPQPAFPLRARRGRTRSCSRRSAGAWVRSSRSGRRVCA